MIKSTELMSILGCFLDVSKFQTCSRSARCPCGDHQHSTWRSRCVWQVEVVTIIHFLVFFTKFPSFLFSHLFVYKLGPGLLPEFGDGMHLIISQPTA